MRCEAKDQYRRRGYIWESQCVRDEQCDGGHSFFRPGVIVGEYRTNQVSGEVEELWH